MFPFPVVYVSVSHIMHICIAHIIYAHIYIHLCIVDIYIYMYRNTEAASGGLLAACGGTGPAALRGPRPGALCLRPHGAAAVPSLGHTAAAEC